MNAPVATEEASRILSVTDAIREGLEQTLERDPNVFILGEGVTDPKGVFGTTAGLASRFGRDRVIEMSVAENGWTGVAIGAAMMGARPIMIHQRLEFALLSIEQLFNNAAKSRYVSNGRHRCPMVVRLVVGRGWGQGPAHSQCLEGVFAAVPGVKVVMPSSASDAKGLLVAAIECDDPVIYIEHRWIHHTRGHVAADLKPIPLCGPRLCRQGDAATVVATSYMTLEAQHAADALAEMDCDVELFDLRVVRPLALEDVIASVERTGRLVTIDTGHVTLGIGAEVVATVCSAAFKSLRSPPLRLGLPDAPTPSSSALAGCYYPRSSHLAQAIGSLCGADEKRLDEICQRLEVERSLTPVDVPFQGFKGPF